MGTTKKMMKCLVCGAIFEEGTDVCPVCGVGPENFVPVETEETTFKKNTEEHFLILGGGAAAVSAAEAVRERNETCTIVIASDEPVKAYNRPMLTKSLMGENTPGQLAIHDDAWYEERSILFLTGRTAQQIDPENREVTFTDGVRLKYDKCIYALGSECFIPPIPGSDKHQVIAIRRLADTDKIANLLPQTKQAVVIGGGVLGLEAAWELHKAGLKVTVLELAPQLMGRQLDSEAGAALKQIILDLGIDIILNVKIEEIEGGACVSGVRLGGGQVIPAQLVIVSAGVRANVGVAKTAGVETGRAITVNSHMETNVPRIYACGDCAEYEGVNYAIWPQALAMGAAAGANAAGDAVEYHQVAAALTFNGMDTTLYAIGDNGKDGNKTYTTERSSKPEEGKYETYYYADGKLVGAILMGDTSKMEEVTEKIAGK